MHREQLSIHGSATYTAAPADDATAAARAITSTATAGTATSDSVAAAAAASTHADLREYVTADDVGIGDCPDRTSGSRSGGSNTSATNSSKRQGARE